MLRKLIEEYEKWGLKVNLEKTKYLFAGGNAGSLKLGEGREISVCRSYKYLGVPFNSTGTDEEEIQARIIQARKAIKCLNGILWNREIGKERKYRCMTVW